MPSSIAILVVRCARRDSSFASRSVSTAWLSVAKASIAWLPRAKKADGSPSTTSALKSWRTWTAKALPVSITVSQPAGGVLGTLEREELLAQVAQASFQHVHAAEHLHALGVADLAAHKDRRSLSTGDAQRFGQRQHALDCDVHQEEAGRLGVEQQARALRHLQDQLAQLFDGSTVLRKRLLTLGGVAALGERHHALAHGLPQAGRVERADPRHGLIDCLDVPEHFNSHGRQRRCGGGVPGKGTVRQSPVRLEPTDERRRVAHQVHAFDLGRREGAVGLGGSVGFHQQQRQGKQQEEAHQAHLHGNAHAPHRQDPRPQQGLDDRHRGHVSARGCQDGALRPPLIGRQRENRA